MFTLDRCFRLESRNAPIGVYRFEVSDGGTFGEHGVGRHTRDLMDSPLRVGWAALRHSGPFGVSSRRFQTIYEISVPAFGVRNHRRILNPMATIPEITDAASRRELMERNTGLGHD